MRRYPSCLLASCCIPWDDQGNFLEDIFRDQVQKALTQGTKHLYLFGTAGEGYAVSDRQFDHIVRAFSDGMHAGGAEPMVGVISLSTATTVERIARSREVGVRRLCSRGQVRLPAAKRTLLRKVGECRRATSSSWAPRRVAWKRCARFSKEFPRTFPLRSSSFSTFLRIIEAFFRESWTR